MLRDHLSELHQRIDNACRRCGRTADEIQVLLVTKKVPPQLVREAYEAGVRLFGENRVQEWLSKQPVLPKDIEWHLIGHLQTNKVKYVIGQVALIQSLDRIELAYEIEKQAERKNLNVDVLLEVNVSREASKYGFDLEGAETAVAELHKSCSHIRFRGLMTIGPNVDREGEIRACFRQLKLMQERFRSRFTEFDWKYLSMGMSSDFEIAIEEGANMIRVGTAVFGARDAK